MEGGPQGRLEGRLRGVQLGGEAALGLGSDD